MLVVIDDALYQQYLAAAKDNGHLATAQINARLRRFLELGPTERALVLTGDQLQQIELTLGGGSLKDAGDLLKRIEDWAGITIGHIRLTFSPAQLQEIGLRAQKQGKSPKELVEDIVRQMESSFFWEPTPTR